MFWLNIEKYYKHKPSWRKRLFTFNNLHSLIIASLMNKTNKIIYAIKTVNTKTLPATSNIKIFEPALTNPLCRRQN